MNTFAHAASEKSSDVRKRRGRRRLRHVSCASYIPVRPAASHGCTSCETVGDSLSSQRLVRAILGALLAIIMAVAMTPIVPAERAYAYVDAGQTVTDNATQFKFYTMTSGSSAYGDIVYSSDLAGEHPIAAAAAGEVVYMHVTPTQGYTLTDAYDCIRVSFAGMKEATLDPHLDSPIVKDATNLFHFTMPDCYALLGNSAADQAAAGSIYAIVTPTYIPRTGTSYTITSQAGTGGTIQNLPTSGYPEDDITFSVVPQTNYAVDSVSVAGDDVGAIECGVNAVGLYEFSMPADNVTVTATFKSNATRQIDPPSPNSLTYNGAAQVGMSSGTGYTLSAPAGVMPQATISGGDAIGTNAGTYPVTATLSSGFSWSDGTSAAKSLSFTISPADISSCTTTLASSYTLEEAQAAAAHAPQLTYTTGTGTPLAVPTSDFTVTYTTNNGAVQSTTFPTTPGSYTAVFVADNIQGATGNFKGIKQVNFTVAETPPTMYNVRLAAVSYGTIQASPVVAAEGATITVDAQPYENYKVTSVTYTDSTGTHQVTETAGAWSFGMPASDVTVGATFELDSAPVDEPKTAQVPIAVRDLVYNGKAQIGVSAGEGYHLWADVDQAHYVTDPSSGSAGSSTPSANATLTFDDAGNATAVNAGSYTLVAELDEGYVWAGQAGAAATAAKELTFTVSPRDIGLCTMATIAPQTYAGSAVTPTVSITDGALGALGEGDFELSYAGNNTVGTATVTATGEGNYTGTLKGQFQIVSAGEYDSTPVALHRLYNPNSGEHFYTADPHEAAEVEAAGWTYEGIGWTAPTSSATPVYRLYDATAGEHFYTTSTADRDAYIAAGCNDEGIGWYSDDAHGVEVLCQVNPNADVGAFNYTVSQTENDYLLSIGWRAGASVWYALAPS
ncbi:hypothetical protein SAMN02910314_01079 [Denitrobacterium detoxificans]|uniref:MBG domain-containing protein n=2 Tax=Denitrobacterium detoxificans TaxID=79604 RepID=A0A1H8S8L5_9ACTN|nr:hypothetical protein SAMN02910314_01079 [Denitrobacterium detoxificans]